MTRLPITLSLLLPIVGACELKGIELTGNNLDSTDGSGSTSGSGSASSDPGTTDTTDPTGDGPTEGGTTGEPPPVTAVDILFVVDNSGSMAGHQRRLVESVPTLLGGLENFDLRIAITTTDVSHPRCNSSPENGEFLVRNCVDAIAEGEFVFADMDHAAACTAHCAVPSGSLVDAATPTAEEPTPEVRAWFERTAGVDNTAVDLDDALACALPQGVAGCGFESPLESMYLALARTTDPASPNFGFLRPEADLRIIFMTDEMDCSFAPAFQEIFDQDSIFSEDPESPATSAVCFNAGMKCTGGPGIYTDCNAVDRDLTGALVTDPQQAVLQPVAKYVQQLQQIQAGKTGAASVQIVALAGVPVGFETGTVPIVWADETKAGQHALFGIAPACTALDPQVPDLVHLGIPPGRLLELAESFGAPQFYSICDDSFDAAMAAVGAK